MADSPKSPFSGPTKRNALPRYQLNQDGTSPTTPTNPKKTIRSPERRASDDFQNVVGITSLSQSTIISDSQESIDDDHSAWESRISEERELVSPKEEQHSPLRPCPTPKETKSARKSNSNYLLYGAIILGVACASGYWYMYSQRWNKMVKIKSRSSCEHFLQLHSKYPNTDNLLWPTLIVSVDLAINRDPGEPATFIFLYNSSNVGQSLLNDVTRITIDCFGSDGAIWRTSNDFQSSDFTEDHGILLDQHRKELKSQGVLVVRDLDRVPPKAAQIFFTICDSYEPLVHKAIIFFTIDTSRQPKQVVQGERSPTSIAEDILKDLWRHELHPNVLDPLVVRLTENVFRIE